MTHDNSCSPGPSGSLVSATTTRSSPSSNINDDSNVEECGPGPAAAAVVELLSINTNGSSSEESTINQKESLEMDVDVVGLEEGAAVELYNEDSSSLPPFITGSPENNSDGLSQPFDTSFEDMLILPDDDDRPPPEIDLMVFQPNQNGLMGFHQPNRTELTNIRPSQTDLMAIEPNQADLMMVVQPQPNANETEALQTQPKRKKKFPDPLTNAMIKQLPSCAIPKLPKSFFDSFYISSSEDEKSKEEKTADPPRRKRMFLSKADRVILAAFKSPKPSTSALIERERESLKKRFPETPSFRAISNARKDTARKKEGQGGIIQRRSLPFNLPNRNKKPVVAVAAKKKLQERRESGKTLTEEKENATLPPVDKEETSSNQEGSKLVLESKQTNEIPVVEKPDPEVETPPPTPKKSKVQKSNDFHPALDDGNFSPHVTNPSSSNSSSLCNKESLHDISSTITASKNSAVPSIRKTIPPMKRLLVRLIRLDPNNLPMKTYKPVSARESEETPTNVKIPVYITISDDSESEEENIFQPVSPSELKRARSMNGNITSSVKSDVRVSNRNPNNSQKLPVCESTEKCRVVKLVKESASLPFDKNEEVGQKIQSSNRGNDQQKRSDPSPPTGRAKAEQRKKSNASPPLDSAESEQQKKSGVTPPTNGAKAETQKKSNPSPPTNGAKVETQKKSNPSPPTNGAKAETQKKSNPSPPLNSTKAEQQKKSGLTPPNMSINGARPEQNKKISNHTPAGPAPSWKKTAAASSPDAEAGSFLNGNSANGNVDFSNDLRIPMTDKTLKGPNGCGLFPTKNGQKVTNEASQPSQTISTQTEQVNAMQPIHAAIVALQTLKEAAGNKSLINDIQVALSALTSLRTKMTTNDSDLESRKLTEKNKTLKRSNGHFEECNGSNGNGPSVKRITRPQENKELRNLLDEESNSIMKDLPISYEESSDQRRSSRAKKPRIGYYFI